MPQDRRIQNIVFIGSDNDRNVESIMGFTQFDEICMGRGQINSIDSLTH